jgi:hypothetical protein
MHCKVLKLFSESIEKYTLVLFSGLSAVPSVHEIVDSPKYQWVDETESRRHCDAIFTSLLFSKVDFTAYCLHAACVVLESDI